MLRFGDWRDLAGIYALNVVLHHQTVHSGVKVDPIKFFGRALGQDFLSDYIQLSKELPFKILVLQYRKIMHLMLLTRLGNRQTIPIFKETYKIITDLPVLICRLTDIFLAMNTYQENLLHLLKNSPYTVEKLSLIHVYL